jgi:hypothetical protein
MNNAELPSSSYDIEFAGGLNNVYVFGTTLGFSYEVSFKPSGYIFAGYQHFSNDVFEFVIALKNNSADGLPLADPLIEATIVRIFRDFFARRGVVVVYICDSSDNRQAVRHRMFNRWFNRYKHLGFVKMDAEFRDPAGTIYTSMLLPRSYPHRDEAITAFFAITDEVNEGK